MRVFWDIFLNFYKEYQLSLMAEKKRGVRWKR